MYIIVRIQEDHDLSILGTFRLREMGGACNLKGEQEMQTEVQWGNLLESRSEHRERTWNNITQILRNEVVRQWVNRYRV